MLYHLSTFNNDSFIKKLNLNKYGLIQVIQVKVFTIKILIFFYSEYLS